MRSVLRWLLGCVLVMGVQLDANAARSRATLDAFLEYNRFEYIHDEPRLRSLEGRLYTWVKQGVDRAELERRLAAEFALTPTLAATLLDLTLARAALKYGDDSTKASLLERYQALSREYPDHDVVFAELAEALRATRGCDGESFDDLVASRPDPERARRELFAVVHCAELVTPLTLAHPDSAEPYRQLADASDVVGMASILRIAALRVSDDLADPSDTEPARADRVGVRAERLRVELTAGNRVSALAALPDLHDPRYASLSSTLDESDLLAIAATLWIAGRPEDGVAWRRLAAHAASSVAGGAAGGGDRPDDDPAYAEERQQAGADRTMRLGLLTCAFDGCDGDPFELLTQQLVQGAFDRGPWDRYRDGVWQPLAVALALREGYPGLTMHPDDGRARHRARQQDDAIAECHRCSPRLLDAMRQAYDTPQAGPGNTETPSAAALAPEILERMERQIDARSPWQENPLPEALRTPLAQHARGGGREDALASAPSRATSPAWAARLPAGELVRYQRDGQRIVAITASQSLDPVGEVSSGGYWISLSEDGGGRFAPPLYTGLRVFAPYAVRSDSKLPLLIDDALQIEVQLRRVDPAKIMFPPIALPIAESRDNIYLSLPLAELQRDSDGDGLTDMAEQAMLLDPALADTDGDGYRDDVDPLPQVPLGVDDANRALALANALNQILGESLGAIVATAAHSGGEPAQGYALGAGTDVHNDSGAEFLVAPADYFRGIVLQRRVIVLSPAQAARVGRARGVFYPIRISVFEIDRASDQGILVWGAGWTGGTFRLKKVDGVWHAEALSRWIT